MTSENEPDSDMEIPPLDLAAYKMAAVRAKALWQAYRDEGFHPEHAFQLTNTALKIVMQDG